MPSRFLSRATAPLAMPPSASLTAPAMPLMPLIKPCITLRPMPSRRAGQPPRMVLMPFHIICRPALILPPSPVKMPVMTFHAPFR